MQELKGLARAVQRYVEARNLPVHGGAARLDGLVASGAAGRRVLQEVEEERQALRRAEREGGFHYLGVHPRPRLGAVEVTGKGVGVEFRAETERWYRKGEAELAYAVSRQHRSLWLPRGEDWVLVDDRVEQEGRSIAPLRTAPGATTEGSDQIAASADIPRGEAAPGGEAIYRRDIAVDYADRWWNGYNPAYRAFDVDCTNYISQCLAAGGAPMWDTGRQDLGWWYRHLGGTQDRWSLSWAVAHSLRWYLAGSRQALQAVQVKDARQLALGDVIHYDFDGDGVWEHSTIVTAFDPAGEPLVNAHTAPSRRRPWRYLDSPAWADRTRYIFWHVLDRF